MWPYITSFSKRREPELRKTVLLHIAHGLANLNKNCQRNCNKGGQQNSKVIKTEKIYQIKQSTVKQSNSKGTYTNYMVNYPGFYTRETLQ